MRDLKDVSDLILSVEDAGIVLLDILRRVVRAEQTDASYYGYDLWIPSAVGAWAASRLGLRGWSLVPDLPALCPPFYDAAWSLVRRGILRWGVRTYQAQAESEGGFSITEAGRRWIVEAESLDAVLVQPGRLASKFAEAAGRFGQAYYERAQEAVRCHEAHAYLACCAMCGAAAEAILLALAIERSGDAEGSIQKYLGSSGRGRTEADVLRGHPESTQQAFKTHLGLMKHWRDGAAHGHAEGLCESEAFLALAQLLRLTQFVLDHWPPPAGD
jgi:hypothetical protein